MPSSNADKMFANLPTQDQGSPAAEVSFSGDPQTGVSKSVTFPTCEQETVASMASSDIEQQLQQPVTFLKQQTQPVIPISFSNPDEQPTTFLCLNQPQLITSVGSLNRENPPFGSQLSSTQGRELVVCAERQGNQQTPERNENVVGNNANKFASTGDNVKEKEGNVDASDFDRNIDNASSWSPFSPMFTCHQFGGDGGSNVTNHAVGGQSNVYNLGSLHNAGGSRSGGGRKHFPPIIYIDDDDDVFVEVSESGEESNSRKKAKNVKQKSARSGTPSKNAKKQHADKTNTVEGSNDGNLQDGLATQGGVEMSML